MKDTEYESRKGTKCKERNRKKSTGRKEARKEGRKEQLKRIQFLNFTNLPVLFISTL